MPPNLDITKTCTLGDVRQTRHGLLFSLLSDFFEDDDDDDSKSHSVPNQSPTLIRRLCISPTEGCINVSKHTIIRLNMWINHPHPHVFYHQNIQYFPQSLIFFRINTFVNEEKMMVVFFNKNC
jgi:hypothetical protein